MPNWAANLGFCQPRLLPFLHWRQVVWWPGESIKVRENLPALQRTILPELRNRTRQHFCYKPECRKARKVKSHQLWLANNPTISRGSQRPAGAAVA